MLTIYDSNGAAIAANDNWQDDQNAVDISENGLAPLTPQKPRPSCIFPPVLILQSLVEPMEVREWGWLRSTTSNNLLRELARQ